jgi:hypothetical protein
VSCNRISTSPSRTERPVKNTDERDHRHQSGEEHQQHDPATCAAARSGEQQGKQHHSGEVRDRRRGDRGLADVAVRAPRVLEHRHVQSE